MIIKANAMIFLIVGFSIIETVAPSPIIRAQYSFELDLEDNNRRQDSCQVYLLGRCRY